MKGSSVEGVLYQKVYIEGGLWQTDRHMILSLLAQVLEQPGDSGQTVGQIHPRRN
jgi:hypothetical protein